MHGVLDRWEVPQSLVSRWVAAPVVFQVVVVTQVDLEARLGPQAVTDPAAEEAHRHLHPHSRQAVVVFQEAAFPEVDRQVVIHPVVAALVLTQIGGPKAPDSRLGGRVEGRATQTLIRQEAAAGQWQATQVAALIELVETRCMSC